MGSRVVNSWALVSIKRRGVCKSRLAGCLAAGQRLELVRRMLAHVLDALQRAAGIEGIACVSEERDTIPMNIPVLPDPGGGLNAALDAARQRLIERGAQQILVLPADLPCVTATEIDALIAAGRTGCALATDRPRFSTNALWVPARSPFRFQFGPQSRLRHTEEARRLGLTVALVESPGLAFDVDGPDDLAALLAGDDPGYRFLLSNTTGSAWAAALRTHYG